MSNLKKAHPTTPLKRGSPHAGEFAILESADLQSPYGLVILIAVCVFLGEALVMLILSILPDLSTVFEAFFDATMLTLLLSPVLYCLVYRPFVGHISELNRAEQLLQEANKELEKKVEARTAELQKHAYDLNERVKELNCLYGISDLFQRPGISLEKILKETVKLIPPSLQYPEITCARIIVTGQEYKTANFKKTEWKQRSDIIVQGKSIGSLEVYCLEEGLQLDERPFMKEERSLINAISERLARIIELKQASEYLKQAHQELSAKTAELKEANAELSQYAYVVSHDLKAPLRAINNYVSFLHEDLGPTLEGEHKEYLAALGRAVQEANELVQGLLEFSHIGQSGFSFESIPAGTFLKELIDSLALPTNVKITMADDWPTIEADAVLLRQVFQNLIENAVKFNDSAEISIELGWHQRSDGRYEFLVSDNGIGVEPPYHEQIFQVFERLHTRMDYKGTGIGLAIVKKAVSILGGSIRIESKPGEGSTFFITLPKAQEAGQIRSRIILREAAIETRDI